MRAEEMIAMGGTVIAGVFSVITWIIARVDRHKDEMNKRFDEMLKRFDQTTNRFDRFDNLIDEIRRESTRRFDDFNKCFTQAHAEIREDLGEIQTTVSELDKAHVSLSERIGAIEREHEKFGLRA